MDSTDTTPRGGRKKKSALSKLVAKKQYKSTNLVSEDEDCQMEESASRTELAKILEKQDICGKGTEAKGGNLLNHRSNRSQGTHNGSYMAEDDSDEGIEVGASGMMGESTIEDRRPIRGALNRLSSVDDRMSEDDDIVCSSTHGEKRLRDKDSDGDDFTQESGHGRTSKKQSSKSAGLLSMSEDVGDVSRGECRSDDGDVHMETDRSIDTDAKEVRRKYEELSSQPEELACVNVSQDEKNLSVNTEHRDSLSDLRKPPSDMTPFSGMSVDRPVFGATTASGVYSSYKHPLPTDTMSQSSYQSTSALPQIEAQKARKRSYLVGSINSNGSMLGSDELERFFPDRKMHVFVGTWNMADMKIVPDCLDDFILPESCDFVQDIYVIGSQESVANRREWEVKLQETLGPQHVLMHSAAHGVLYLCIFVRRDLLWYCSVCEDDTVSTRAGPASVKTKGAIAVCFTIFGTSLLFVNSHFTAHDGKVKERIADYKKICTGIQLPRVVIHNPYQKSLTDVTTKFDAVFWSGDLNFRILHERDHIHDAVQGIEAEGNFQNLVQHDELFLAMNEGKIFQDFQEGRIKFKPSYKFDIGTHTYDTKKLRIPSYTDRILFRSKKKNCVTCLYYDSAHSIKISDHKPVFGLFEIVLRPGRDNIPLAAGQFNRDIWLEANRRRAQKHDVDEKSDRSSTVCSIQ